MIFKYVRNRRRAGNKVSGRYKYITSKSDYVIENTLERFDFAVKRRFGKKQDTTHYVISFERKLNEKEKEKARKIISEFFFEKFSDYFISIAEHNDNQHTHYHILFSRNLNDAKMLNSHIKRNEFLQLQKKLREKAEQELLLTNKEKAINQKYIKSVEENKVQKQLSAYEYKQYKKLKSLDTEKFVKLVRAKDKLNRISKRAILKAYIEKISKALYEKDFELLKKLRALEIAKIKRENDTFYLLSSSYKYKLEKLSKVAYMYLSAYSSKNKLNYKADWSTKITPGGERKSFEKSSLRSNKAQEKQQIKTGLTTEQVRKIVEEVEREKQAKKQNRYRFNRFRR